MANRAFANDTPDTRMSTASTFLRERVLPLRRHATVRVAVLIVLLFIATYGGVAVLRMALQTESPLMVVSSGSMIPTLNVGDIIIVRGISAEDVTVGSIIIFHNPRNYEMPIVHRVIEIAVDGNGQRYFVTKGDNNPVPDNWSPNPGVPADYLIGVLAMRIPYVGLVSLRLRGTTGIAVILILIAAIILLEYRDERKRTNRTRIASSPPA